MLTAFDSSMASDAKTDMDLGFTTVDGASVLY